MSRRDSLRYEALLCEREAFGVADPRGVNASLMSRADLLKRAGDYAESLSLLSQVRMYMLSPDERYELTVQKALCAYLSKDYDASLSYLAEAGAKLSTDSPKRKNEYLAMALTFLVPAGYAYAEAPWTEAVLSTALNAGSIAWTITQLAGGLYPAGGLGGAIALSYTFLGAQERVATLVENYNSSAVVAAKREAAYMALKELL